jgi:hypothetical protein
MKDSVFVDVFKLTSPCCGHRPNWTSADYLNDVWEYSRRNAPSISIAAFSDKKPNPYHEMGYTKYSIHICKVCSDVVAYQYRKPKE